MATQHSSHSSSRAGWRLQVRARPLDSYGFVLFLILLDNFAVATISVHAWGAVVTTLLLGITLLFALRTSHTRRLWQLLALFFLIAGTLAVVIVDLTPGLPAVRATAPLSAGVLLIVTPIAIVQRVARHKIVTVDTILGAVSVYLLLGFTFASIFVTISLLTPAPFFQNTPQAGASDYLFFSYTTLTTVGYGNLVPAGSLGQAFASLEALLGQIYLVIIVARLVSLWGHELRPADGGAQPGRAQLIELKRGQDPDARQKVSPSPPMGEA